jgi:hypothetical protein
MMSRQTIALQNLSNGTVARVPVRQNVYALEQVPRTAVRVVALDSDNTPLT